MQLVASSRGEPRYLGLVIRPRHPGSDPRDPGRGAMVPGDSGAETGDLGTTHPERERSTPNNNIQLLPRCQPAHTQHGLNKYYSDALNVCSDLKMPVTVMILRAFTSYPM